jgi:hypothetical protein
MRDGLENFKKGKEKPHARRRQKFIRYCKNLEICFCRFYVNCTVMVSSLIMDTSRYTYSLSTIFLNDGHYLSYPQRMEYYIICFN